MSTELQIGESILRPRARLIKTIGEELISNDIVAVLELVKNSYDADASITTINFNGRIVEVEENKKRKKILLKEGASIVIEDDGSGMSLSVVEEAWMEPATIMKKVTKNSPSKSRRYTGEKGIGRFASAKLSEELNIITKIESDNEVHVHFNWDDFTNDEKYLDEIKCSWEVKSPTRIKTKGTILELLHLNSDWDEAKFRELRITLSRLLNPVAPIEDFLMELSLPDELKNLSGLINPPDSINKPDYLIKGTVDSSAIAHIIYQSRQISEPVIYDKDLSKDLNPIRIPSSGQFAFEFRVWDREKDSLDRLAKEVGSTFKNIRTDLDDLSGVSIYRDGFRVLPYGEKKNDWLRLDLRRVNNPTLRISNNQLVGYISISLDTNSEFKDQSNREGIIESEAFTDLQEQIKIILNELESRRYKERPRKEDTEHRESLFSRFSIADISLLIRSKLPNDQEIINALTETQKKIDDGVEKVQQVISRYRRLSTLGLLIDVILHDGNTFLLRIDSQTQLLQKEINKQNPDRELITKYVTSISELRKLLAQLFKRIEPFGGRTRGRPHDIIVENSIKNIFELYKTEIDKLNIQLELPQSQNTVRINEGELQIIIVNLLQNTLHWITKVEHRKIIVKVERSNEELSIIFSDSGPGIDESDAKVIFDPYFSRRPDGIGIGLTIVGELVSEYDGEFLLVNNGPLDGATFKIIFRRRI